MSSLKHVSDTDFEANVLKNEKAVVVDFWAEWCGPCKALGPVLEAAAAKTGVEVVKMNVDENLETPVQYGIRGIPTLIAFKGGQPVATLVGMQEQGALEAWLKANA
jgi:thioredoxin 1